MTFRSRVGVSHQEVVVYQQDLLARPAVDLRYPRPRIQRYGIWISWFAGIYADMDKTNNRGARVAKKDQDENMLDEDEDIAIAKVIQASLDDAKAEKTKAQLKALQKEMGVGTKRSSNFLAPDADIAAEDDRFMELDEQDGDEKNDVVMIEGDEVDSYSGEGRDDEGYEV